MSPYVVVTPWKGAALWSARIRQTTENKRGALGRSRAPCSAPSGGDVSLTADAAGIVLRLRPFLRLWIRTVAYFVTRLYENFVGADPVLDRYFVLLTSRVYAGVELRDLRRAFHVRSPAAGLVISRTTWWRRLRRKNGNATGRGRKDGNAPTGRRRAGTASAGRLSDAGRRWSVAAAARCWRARRWLTRRR